MKMEDVRVVQERTKDKIKQGRSEPAIVDNPEAEQLYHEMCDLFDKLVALTKQCAKK